MIRWLSTYNQDGDKVTDGWEAHTAWRRWTTGWFVYPVGWSRPAQGHHATRNSGQFETYELLISRISHLTFSDHQRLKPWVSGDYSFWKGKITLTRRQRMTISKWRESSRDGVNGPHCLTLLTFSLHKNYCYQLVFWLRTMSFESYQED